MFMVKRKQGAALVYTRNRHITSKQASIGARDGHKGFWLLLKFMPYGGQQFPEELSQAGRFQTSLQSLSNGFRAGSGLHWFSLCRYLSLLLHLLNLVFTVGRNPL